MNDDIDKATREFLLSIATFDAEDEVDVLEEQRKFDELVAMTAKFVKDQIRTAVAPRVPDVVFTLLFHKDLREEDAIDIDIAIKALALIAARRGNGIVIRSCKSDGSQADVPVLVPMGETPKGVN